MLASRKIHQRFNVLVLKRDLGFIKPEIHSCVNKLHETWNRKRELLEESNIQVLEEKVVIRQTTASK